MIAAEIFFFVFIAAFYAPLAVAGVLSDNARSALSTLAPSPEAKSEGLMQRGRERLRSFGNRNQAAQKIASNKIPKLIITATGVDYEHSHLRLGDSMKRWKDVLKGTPRCSDEKPSPVICVWDDIGIELLTRRATGDSVIQLEVHLSFDDDWWMKMPSKQPDGTSAAPVVDWTPHHSFAGYLEVDGVAIDAETKLSSVLAGVKRERNFRCGFRDCTAARGLLGTMSLQAEPEGRTPQGVIRRLSVNSQ